MEYLCIWNAFEQDSSLFNHIKEIGRLAAAAAVSQQPSLGGASASASASSTSAASSTASSPRAVSKEPPAAVTSAFSSTRHFPASLAHVAALAATQQQLQQRITAAAYQQGQAELPAQSPMFINQHQLPGAAHQQQSGTGVGLQQLHQNNSNMANSLLWQPWRDLQQAAAMHHQLYKQQQQQQQQLFKGSCFMGKYWIRNFEIKEYEKYNRDDLQQRLLKTEFVTYKFLLKYETQGQGRLTEREWEKQKK